MNKKLFTILACGILLFSACGKETTTEGVASSSVSVGYDMIGAPEAERPINKGETMMAGATDSGGFVPGADTDKKIIKNANLNFETTDYDTAYSQLLSAIKTAGGDVENSSMSNSGEPENSLRRLSITVRIPEKNYGEFISSAELVARLLSKNEYTSDVTAQYVDTDARLNNLKAQEKRLLELLETAQTLTDVLDIETRLSEVRYQIESYTTQINTMDNQISYSSVYISLNETKTQTVLSDNFITRLGKAFTDGINALGTGLAALLVAIAASLPTLFIVVIVGGLIYGIIRIIRKRK